MATDVAFGVHYRSPDSAIPGGLALAFHRGPAGVTGSTWRLAAMRRKANGIQGRPR